MSNKAMAIDEFCKELGRRVVFIRDICEQFKVPLKPDQGLTLALNEAEALSVGKKSKDPLTPLRLNEAVRCAHVVYAIAESLETCAKVGLDVSDHLRQMTTGTANYGTPGSYEARTIFLKDFEFELFVASALIRGGIIPEFFPQSNDPRGDMFVGQIFIECKHPNSVGQLETLLRKFNAALRRASRFGVFAIAVEDAFNLGDRDEFATQVEFDFWLEAKRVKMETEGLALAKRAAKLHRIASIVYTSSFVEIVAGGSSMRRLSNSIIFDHRETFEKYAATAGQIAKVFNPVPGLSSALKLGRT